MQESRNAACGRTVKRGKHCEYCIEKKRNLEKLTDDNQQVIKDTAEDSQNKLHFDGRCGECPGKQTVHNFPPSTGIDASGIEASLLNTCMVTPPDLLFPQNLFINSRLFVMPSLS